MTILMAFCHVSVVLVNPSQPSWVCVLVGTEGAIRSAVLAGTDGHSDAVHCAGHCATSGHHRPGWRRCAVGGGAL